MRAVLLGALLILGQPAPALDPAPPRPAPVLPRDVLARAVEQARAAERAQAAGRARASAWWRPRSATVSDSTARWSSAPPAARIRGALAAAAARLSAPDRRGPIAGAAAGVLLLGVAWGLARRRVRRRPSPRRRVRRARSLLRRGVGRVEVARSARVSRESVALLIAIGGRRARRPANRSASGTIFRGPPPAAVMRIPR